MIGDFPPVFTFNRLFLELNGSSVTNCRFSPIIEQDAPISLVESVTYYTV